MTIKDKIDRDRSDEQLWKFVHINKEGRVGLVDTKIGGDLEVSNLINANNLVASKIGYDNSGADLSGFGQFLDLSSTSLKVFGDAYINGNLNVDTIFKRTITEVDIDISGNLELFHNLDVSGVITGIGGLNLLGTTDFNKINNVTIGYDLSGRGAFTDLSATNLFTKNFTSDEIGYDVSGKGAFSDLSAQNFSLFQDFTIGSSFASNTKLSSRGTSNLILTTNENINSPNIEIISGANNNIDIKPTGTGSTVFGNGTNRANITTNGTQNLLLDTNSGTNTGLIRIITGTNGNILLSPHGNGNILLGDGINHQKITTSGQKNLILNTNNNTSTPAVIINAGTVGNIDLKHNAAGMVIVGNGSVSGKITSNGTNDLVLNTQSNNANSGSITIKNGINQNILLSTNGSGSLVVGNGNNSSTITTAGAQNLVLNTNNGSSSGSITIEDGVNGNITLSPDGTGKVIFGTSINVSGHNGVDNGLSLGGILITSNANELNFNDGSSPGIITFNKTVVYSSDGGVNMSKLILNGSSVDVTGDELNFLDNASPGVVTNSKCVVYSAAGKVNATQLQLSGSDITASADEINRMDGSQPGVVTSNKCVIYNNSGSVNCNSLTISGVAVSTSATELNLLDGSLIGSIVNNKAVIYDSSGGIFGNRLIVGSGGGQGEISTNGDYDLLIKTGSTSTSSIKIVDGANGNIELSTVGAGKIFTTSNITGQGGVTFSGTISLNNMTFPSTDGTSNQILKTDGAGNLSFTNFDLNALSDILAENNSYYFGTNPTSTNNAEYNSAFGKDSLLSITTGDYNTAIGGLSNTTNQTGNQNTSVGYRSLYLNTASNNTAIGYLSGDKITTGAGNTLIGNNADTSAANSSNEIVIGSDAVGQGNNIAVIGDQNITNICSGSDNIASLGSSSKNFKDIYLKGSIISSIATGTAPFTVQSTTQVNNLFATKAATVPITSTTDTSCFIAIVENSSGDNAIKIDTNMSYNATTNTLSVTNLNVSGTQNITNTNTVETAGAIISVGQNSTNDSSDRGLKFLYNDGSAKIGFIGFDDTDGKFTMIPNATEDTGHIFSGSVGTLKANLEGTATNATSAVSVTGNSQTNITSVGTLTTLTVDDVNIDGKVLTITGDTGDTATFTGGANGTLAITTTDSAGANANITITADGTSELAGTAITLNSSGNITLDADGGTTTFSDNGVTGMSLTNQNLLVEGNITYNGSLGTSDDRIKHNEIDVSNGLQIIRQLVPKKYFKTKEMYDASHNFILDPSGNPIDSSGNIVSHSIEIGLIAQSILQIPDLSFSVQNIESNTTPLTLNYNNIFVQSIAAIKELDNLVTQQTTNLETEKSKIIQLQNNFNNFHLVDNSDQIFYGTKSFNSQINGSISGSSNFVTNSVQNNITAISNGTNGLTIQGTGPVTAYSLKSTVETGTPPLTVSSTTPVPNLNIEGNSGSVSNGVYTHGNQIIDGTKKFNSIIDGSITGSSGFVSNSVQNNITTISNGTNGLTIQGTGPVTAYSLKSTVETGIPPLTVSSTTPVNNLNIEGNAGSVTNGVYTNGNQIIDGTKKFNSIIDGSISGNSSTVTNGVYTTSDQVIQGSKTFESTINGSISGSSSFVTNSVQNNITTISNGTNGLTIQGTGPITANTLKSTVETGIPPLTISSTTPVPNLNIQGNAGSVTNGVYTNGNQIIDGTKKFNSIIDGSISGNSTTVTNGVYTTGDQVIQGSKTFNSIIDGSISGNSNTVTNGVYTTGDQVIQGSKTFESTINGSISGNAFTATKASEVVSAHQPIITSIGKLTQLDVDNINLNENSIKITPSTGNFSLIDVSTNGEMSISTTDSNSSNANINIIPDGNSNIYGKSVNLKSDVSNINLDSKEVINFFLNGINYGSITSNGYTGNSATVTNGIYTTSSVTNLSDVTDKGSGKIISDSERLKLNTISSYANVTDSNTVAASGAVMNTGNISISGVKTFENIRINPNQVNYSSGLENVISTTGVISSAIIKIGPLGIPAGSLITNIYGIFTTPLVGTNIQLKIGTTEEGIELMSGSALTIDPSNYSKGFSSSNNYYGESIEQSSTTSLQNLYFSSESNIFITLNGNTLTAGEIKLFIKFIV